MDVLGITALRDIRIRPANTGRDRIGVTPVAVVANDTGLPDRPPHGLILPRTEANRSKIETAMRQKADGTGTPHAPFDMIALAEEM